MNCAPVSELLVCHLVWRHVAISVGKLVMYPVFSEGVLRAWELRWDLDQGCCYWMTGP